MSTLTHQSPGHAAPRRRVRRPWPIALLAVATVGMVWFLLSAYVPPVMKTSRIPPRSELHYVLLVAHIATAAIAAVAGTAQFWPWLRRRFPVVHRWTGRAYFFLGVFPSAVLAVPVTVLAPFGAANQAALATLDVLWVLTAVAGYRAVRQRRFADHRRWMIRNFALIWGSLASRFWTPLLLLAIAPQESSMVYRGDATAILHDIASGSAWLGLISSLLIAEYYLQRRYGVPGPRRAPVRSTEVTDRRTPTGALDR